MGDDIATVTEVDIEAAFLLATPLHSTFAQA
jgi:hypothetical protein